MIKAHLPPEKSVYSLPRAAPGSPKPSRPHIPVRRPAAIPVPAPETTPREPALKPSLQPPAPETIPGTISETTAPETDLQTPGPPRPLRKPGHFPRSKAIHPGQGTLPGTNIDRE